MRIYFSSLGIGLGHVSRSVALAKRLASLGAEVAISSYGDALKFVERNNNGIKKVFYGGKPISWVMGPYGSPDLLKTLTNIRDIPKFIEHIRVELSNLEEFTPDVVVSDSRVSAIIAAKMMDVPVVTVLNQPKLLISPLVNEAIYKVIKGFYVKKMSKIPELVEKALNTAMTLLWSSSESAIIADFPPPDSISRAQTSNLPRRILAKTTFSGPLIEVKCKNRSEENVILILVSGPGEERESLARVLRDMLEELSKSFPNFKVIISLGNPGSDEVIEKGNVLVYQWLPSDKKWKYLSEAKIVISRAGHTTISESLLCGKPLILIPTPKHTEKIENARSVANRGLGVLIDQSEVRGLLVRTIKHVMEDNTIKENVNKFKEKYRKWDFLDRAVGPILSSIR